MGMEQIVAFPHSRPPTFSSVAELLARRGFPISLRMIDGQLTLPDETMPEAWTELRLGTPAGMVSVRREGERLRLVVWGNSDPAMRQAWNAIVWAFAETGDGRVELADGPKSAADYGRSVEMPAGLKIEP